MSKPPRLLSLLAVATISVGAFGACGGGGDESPQQRTEACRDEMPVRATALPGGFDAELVKGPGGGQDTPEDTVAYHWQGPQENAYIDAFRGGFRNDIKRGTKVQIMGRTGRTKEIAGGRAARVRLGRGTCSRYQFEAFGVPEDDFARFLSGLRRAPTEANEE